MRSLTRREDPLLVENISASFLAWFTAPFHLVVYDDRQQGTVQDAELQPSKGRPRKYCERASHLGG